MSVRWHDSLKLSPDGPDVVEERQLAGRNINLIEPTMESKKTKSLAEIAAGSAHALNNVTSVLYAASAYLGNLPESKTLNRARVAVEKAAADALSLGAAFTLLALDPSTDERSSQEPVRFEARDLGRIFQETQHVANTDFAAPEETWSPRPILVTPETLMSVLVCASVTIRRRISGETVLRCTWQEQRAGSPEATGLVFELHASEVPAPSEDRLLSRHPCELALDHATAPLLAKGLIIEQPTLGNVRIIACFSP